MFYTSKRDMYEIICNKQDSHIAFCVFVDVPVRFVLSCLSIVTTLSEARKFVDYRFVYTNYCEISLGPWLDEQGRYFRPKISRKERNCDICQIVEDEEHFVLFLY